MLSLSFRPMIALLAGATLYSNIPTVTAAPISNPKAVHHSAIEQARQGQHKAALKQLNSLVQAYPENRLFRYDYISALSWAERDEEVLAQLSHINFEQAPAYVLKAIGKSARNRQRPKLAIRAYRAALKQTSNERQARLGLAMSLAEARQPVEANKQIQSLLKINPESIELLNTLAYIKETDHDYAGAFDVYDRVLMIEPDNKSARHARVLSLLRLGVPHEALQFARRDTRLFSPEEWNQMLGDQAAIEIRWGQQPVVDPSQRYRNTDKAIELLKSQREKITRKTSPAYLRNRFDLIAAYRNRRYMREAVTLYEQLHKDGIKKFPPYVQALVGDAYLSLRQPEPAIILLEKSVNKDPDNLDAQYSLYYAYLESGRYEKSLTHIDTLADSLPQWIWPPGNQEKQLNFDKLYALTISAMARAYTGKLGLAKHRLDALRTRDPDNIDIQNSLAHVSLWRGWPRSALERYRAVLAQNSENTEAKTGIVNALFARGNLAEAETALKPLQRQYNDYPPVKNLTREANILKMREVWLEVNGGSSSDTTRYQGSSDLGFTAYYYDRPWRLGLRSFAYLSHLQANFSGETATRNRGGVGLHYQQQDIVLRGNISGGDGSTGLSLQGDWNPTDHWQGSLSIATFSEQTPLRADLTGVKAQSLDLGTKYRFHESRSLGASLQYMDFDDGNQRNTLSAFGQQRLFTGLRYTLTGELYLYHQTNTADNAAYFNPSKQNSVELSFNNEWLTYLRYEKSMRQRLKISVGSNSQQKFNTKSTWMVSYEHHWSFSQRLSIAYGISRSRPVYDGVQESFTRGFMNLYVRF
ncbi:MAG: poly-beta-1,6 N-acetyl-D-glucosamine export porin PgaA [Gammaproteobacteria bacterium]|nr:poly-beta-1,6 N-acetyl-D-glucosamine export porin PgaA [Gammaproteobacteria bacterium]